MRLLVLGGTGFLGREAVRAARQAGWAVTTFNRGRGVDEPGVETVRGDRRLDEDLAPLAQSEFDCLIDTWAGAPEVVSRSARLLASSVDRYCYVSSRAVYLPPTPAGMDESWPTVAASPEAGPAGYPADKRGGEMAVEEAFGERALLARAALILGPGDESDRLTCWLRRARQGGPMAVPGPPELPVRFVDVRDLASFLLAALEAGLSGPVNLCNREGHTTMASLMEAVTAVTGELAEPVWVTPEQVASARTDRRVELPGWLPDEPELAGLVHTDVERAHAAGLSCRSARTTVEDTWAWSLATSRFTEKGPLGLEPGRERHLLDMAGRPG